MQSRRALIAVPLVIIVFFHIYFMDKNYGKKNYISTIRTAKEFFQTFISNSNQNLQYVKESQFQGVLQDPSSNLSKFPGEISESDSFGRIPQSEVCVLQLLTSLPGASLRKKCNSIRMRKHTLKFLP